MLNKTGSGASCSPLTTHRTTGTQILSNTHGAISKMHVNGQGNRGPIVAKAMPMNSQTTQMICDFAQAVRVGDIDLSGELSVYLLGHRVAVETTPCHFGGVRYWFLCPFCERRCAVIYKKGCRLCANGRYRSESLSPKARLLHKALKRRRRLGQSRGGLTVRFPPRPKWMHEITYERLQAEAEHEEGDILADLMAQLSALSTRAR